MPKANEIAKLGEYALPTASYTPVSSAPGYDFQQPKRIGNEFPASGYGARLFHPCFTAVAMVLLIHLALDDYFHFVDSAVYPQPTRIPLSELPSLDSLKDILTQGDLDAPSPVQLSSEKSGIKLKFFSNRL